MKLTHQPAASPAHEAGDEVLYALEQEARQEAARGPASRFVRRVRYFFIRITASYRVARYNRRHLGPPKAQEQPAYREYPDGFIGNTAAYREFLAGKPLDHPGRPHGWIVEPGTPEHRKMTQESLESLIQAARDAGHPISVTMLYSHSPDSYALSPDNFVAACDACTETIDSVLRQRPTE